MAILSKDELFSKLQEIIGDKTDDATLGFLEDVKETVEDYEVKGAGTNEDWKAKYEENDKKWRTKYRDTFFGKAAPDTKIEDNADNINIEKETKPEESVTFDDLFDKKED